MPIDHDNVNIAKRFIPTASTTLLQDIVDRPNPAAPNSKFHDDNNEIKRLCREELDNRNKYPNFRSQQISPITLD